MSARSVSLVISLFIASLSSGLIPQVVLAQPSRTDHIVWLVGDWNHRNRTSGMYDYLKTKLQETFLHDGCLNDGDDVLDVNEFYYNNLEAVVSAGAGGNPEAVAFCEAVRGSLPAPGTHLYTLTVVGLGTGVVFAKNAFVEFGGVGQPCELPPVDSFQIRVDYVWIDQPTGFNDEPSILHPHSRWDPYRAYATNSSEMQSASESLRVYGSQACRPDGPVNEAGCGYEYRRESSFSAYNPFLGYAPPSIGNTFANPERRSMRKEILLDINLSWYSQFGNVAFQNSCKCPSNVGYWNNHHMLICWCDGSIEYIGGYPVCQPFQMPLEWLIDPDLFWGGGCHSDPACAQLLADRAFDPPEPPTNLPYCGNGSTDLGEECDDGNNADDDGCTSGCIKEKCGDGTVQAGIGEECDDRNGTNQDGCSASCKLEICGDGIKQGMLGEMCDDGNTVSGDGCNANCEKEYCGDGIVQDEILGESCDGASFSDDCPKRVFMGCMSGWNILVGCSKKCECLYGPEPEEHQTELPGSCKNP